MKLRPPFWIIFEPRRCLPNTFWAHDIWGRDFRCTIWRIRCPNKKRTEHGEAMEAKPFPYRQEGFDALATVLCTHTRGRLRVNPTSLDGESLPCASAWRWTRQYNFAWYLAIFHIAKRSTVGRHSKNHETLERTGMQQTQRLEIRMTLHSSATDGAARTKLTYVACICNLPIQANDRYGALLVDTKLHPSTSICAGDSPSNIYECTEYELSASPIPFSL